MFPPTPPRSIRNSLRACFSFSLIILFFQTAGGGKYIRLSPKPFGSATNGGVAGPSTSAAAASSSPSSSSGAAGKSPVRRPRGDAKKCRKVYGMEHREMWCTQCKWKKACTRFGEAT